jgi:hypothetical protein
LLDGAPVLAARAFTLLLFFLDFFLAVIGAVYHCHVLPIGQ